MDSLSIILSSSPPIPVPKIQKLKTIKPNNNQFTTNSNSFKTQSLIFTTFQFPLSSLASEETPTKQVSNKIDLEAIVVSIDDFFNRYPFFVAGVVFIWLFVIPFTEEYLRKYKSISAIDAFKKLKEDPGCELLDIRDSKTLRVLGSPNLKFLNKNAVHVEFRHKDFLKRVKDKFKDPANTTLCILDNFDGESMKVAELLFKNGFKEAYAIRGGVRGTNGWLVPCTRYHVLWFSIHTMILFYLFETYITHHISLFMQICTSNVAVEHEIQETLLPPSVHISLKRNVKKSTEAKNNGAIEQQSEVKSQPASVAEIKQTDNGYANTSKKPNARSLSPYPMYPDMKPPSSPTPSKPQ